MPYFIAFFVFLCCFSSGIVFAEEDVQTVPRFASLSSEEVYFRAGPGKQYPVKWVYHRSGYPVEIVREFEHWRKVQDREGYSGWVYKGLLSARRTALVMGISPDQQIWLTRAVSPESQKIARIEPGAILFLKECTEMSCRGSSQGITGWIERKYLWGIYDHEIID